MLAWDVPVEVGAGRDGDEARRICVSGMGMLQRRQRTLYLSPNRKKMRCCLRSRMRWML